MIIYYYLNRFAFSFFFFVNTLNLHSVSNSGATIAIVIIMLLLVLGAAAGAFYYYRKRKRGYIRAGYEPSVLTTNVGNFVCVVANVLMLSLSANKNKKQCDQRRR